MPADTGSVIYGKNQLLNVICQLRFPAQSALSEAEPTEFREAVRKDFPLYRLQKGSAAPGSLPEDALPRQSAFSHTFASADGGYIMNLTDSFIAFSAPRYPFWGAFAEKLDWTLSEFLRIYRPAYFERVGLRYINGFSREALGLAGTPWRALIRPPFLGFLEADEIGEDAFSRCTQDAELTLRGCHVRLHTGPGIVRRGGVPERVPRFILDLDVFLNGSTPPPELAGALQTLHLNAERLFRSALTDTLHEAMEPR